MSKELDARVAEYVFKLKKKMVKYNDETLPTFYNAKYNSFMAPSSYSTKIERAWDIVEHYKAKQVYISILHTESGYLGALEANGAKQFFLEGPSVPELICRLALKYEELKKHKMLKKTKLIIPIK